MDLPIILSDMDYVDEEEVSAPPTALTEAMAGTAMTMDEIHDWFGQDF